MVARRLLRPRRGHASPDDGARAAGLEVDATPEDQSARLHREWLARRTATRTTAAPVAHGDDDLRAMVEAERERRGITPPTPAEDARHAEWSAQQRALRSETIEDVLARSPHPPDPPPARRPDFSERQETAEERIGRLAVERSWAAISDATAVCSRGCAYHPPDLDAPDRCGSCGSALVPVTWARLVDLQGPARDDGSRLSALGGILDQHGRILVGGEAVRELRERLACAGRAVLIGDTRAGKSMAAAAFANELLTGGADGVRWIPAVALREAAVLERAKTAKRLFLDDLGEELFMAAEKTGLAAQRVPPVCELFGALARSRGQRCVVTTFLEFEPMAKIYGVGVAARVYEGATKIRIVRPT